MKKEYECTDCGGDATVAMSNFKDVSKGVTIIGKDERLCLPCAKKRGVEFWQR